MRNMSFSKTTEQVRNKTKTVTRRFAWWNLKPGDRVMSVEKSQGLKRGEKVVPIWAIEIVSAKGEQVQDIRCKPNDLILEGFPDLPADEFINLLCKGTGKTDTSPVNRIEFKYI